MMIKLTEKGSDDNARDIDAPPNAISAKKRTRTHWGRYSFIIIVGNRVQNKRRSSFSARGVRKSHGNSHSSIIFLSRKRKRGGVGVRNPDTTCMIRNEHTVTGRSLMYNKPCICVSLNHRNTKDSDCLLNKQHMD